MDKVVERWVGDVSAILLSYGGDLLKLMPRLWCGKLRKINGQSLGYDNDCDDQVLRNRTIRYVWFGRGNAGLYSRVLRVLIHAQTCTSRHLTEILKRSIANPRIHDQHQLRR